MVFAIQRHESHTGACVPHPEPPFHFPSPPHPSGLSQSAGFEGPASCIKPAICFYNGNVHVSLLFSQIIPPSPSPTVQRSVFTSVSLLLSSLEKPTPVFLPAEFRGQRNLVGCSPWGCKESDTTEQLTLFHLKQSSCEYFKYVFTNSVKYSMELSVLHISKL